MSRGGVIVESNPQTPGGEAGRTVSGANQEMRYLIGCR
jgi:hypothetical protein